MRKILWAITLCVGATNLAVSTASADELVMKNGSRLIGKIVSADEEIIKFEIEFAGTISIETVGVASLSADDEVTVMLEDGRVIENTHISGSDDGLVMLSEDNNTVRFEMTELQRLNPKPWELGRGYNRVAKVSMAAQLDRGNTESDQLDLAAQVAWRSLTDRLTSQAYYELDTNEGVRNKKKWLWRNKYDYFSAQDPDSYLGFLLLLEGDEFADIDLTTKLGPYLGRQFYSSKLLSLSGDVGVVWVNEQRDPDREDISLPDENEYYGANWSFQITSDYFGETSNFYINHDGVLDLSNSDDVQLNATMGFSLDLWGGTVAGIEARLEYDGIVGEDREKLDQTYQLRLGYKF